MSLNHYKLYLEQVFQLAETTVIKSEDSAVFLNKRVAFLYGDNAVNPVDKTSWKYYLNLAGKYHPFDEKITITSLDTLRPIEFSAASLLLHTATAKAYNYGSRYYRELLTQYPTHEQFIMGALYPVDETVSTVAPDFSVLGYPDQLIETNEESLTNNINKWLKNYKTRWYNKQYNMSDNLYLASLLGIMYQQLVPLILTLRLRACKTAEAHSYHVREYLASNGMLDEYLDFMTRKQALFFYRNINYIERNPGRVETFNWLLEKVLTDRNIPVAEINLAQSDADLLTSYKPTTRFSSHAINKSTAEDTSATAFYTLTELLTKEALQAPNNIAYTKQNYQNIEAKFSQSKTNTLKTKVLESRMIDYTDAGLYSIQDTTLDLWCHLSTTGQYSAAINYINKLTNKTLSIPNHVAFLYFLYAYCQVHGIEVETVPEFFAQRVAIDPLPSVQDLAKVVDKRIVSTEDLEYLVSLHTPLESLISTTAFNAFVNKSYTSYKAEHMFAAVQNDIYKRALIKNATYRLYKAQREVSPYIGQKFITVFKTFGLQTTGLDTGEWANVYKEIYKKSTGMDLLLTETQSALQSTMIKLFKKLSSYSIQFLSEINKTTIRSVNWSATRMGDFSRYSHDLRRIQLPVFKIFKLLSQSQDYRLIELKQQLQKVFVLTEVDIGLLDPTVNAWAARPVSRHQLNINTLVPNLQNLDACAIKTPEQLPEFLSYYALTSEEKRGVRDIYQNRVTDEDEAPTLDLDSMLFIPKALAASYLRLPTNRFSGFTHAFLPDSFELRVEREFTDLDAFESNFGHLNAVAFKLFKGVSKNVLGFKLTPGPIVSKVQSFKYVGGILYNPGFGFSLNLEGDSDIGGFIFLSPPTVNVESLTAVYDQQIINLTYGQGNQGLNLEAYSVTSDNRTLGAFNIILDNQTIDVGTLAAGNMQLAFKLTTNGSVRIKSDFVIVNYPSITLDDISLDTGAYALDDITLATGGTTIVFVLATTHNLGSYSFNNYAGEIAFNGFVKDTRQLSTIFFAAGSVEFNSLDFSLIKQEVGGFVIPHLTQELDSFVLPQLIQEIGDFMMLQLTQELGGFNFYPPMEISFLFIQPLSYEIGSVTYDGTLKKTEIS